jgi:RND family efflux transporter MFP subunit
MKIKKFNELSGKNKVLLAVSVVVLVAVGWKVVRTVTGQSQQSGQRAGTVAVEVAPVEEGLIRDLGLFSGTLIPKSQFVIAPKVSGKLKRLYVDIGDSLRNGQLVAQLEDEEYQQQVIQAEADLNVARANLEEAKSSMELSKKEFERAQSLHQKGIMSDAQLDSSRAQYSAQESRYKVAAAQVSNKEAALEAARVRLSYTRIATTWEKGGSVRHVGERFVDEGALLSPNTPIISVIELQPITAVIHATDKEYFRIKPEQDVQVTSTVFPGKLFHGRVTRVAPLLKETSRQARVEIDIDNEEALLKPGMFVNAAIEFARRERSKLVPFSALVQRNNLQGVFIADINEKKAAFKPVTVGIVEGEKAEVIEPAGISGYVVVLGQHLLQDGMGIILPERLTGGQAGAGQKGPAKAAPTKAR